ncbi:transglutaminase family protein [Frankia sp. CNm7]|uniref:Transglutaminase family protein n=1 Tax=Frankia nepalensis TaxID=1836974 RepID=A0A937URQ9_9ACTN|nr:transglutaminase family protein [Frankia nepalensis]MBL7496997.1 transglutaminase family protein [Frankia nepalensis]MBL7510535.1 transglutaminase family protein [Frankia nepalensis]MBL7521275.1 transglutaminase family protein [Frankia nepalensis]MBL7629490.1 transglutaminase family protein [Frankia nepalensis]
MGALAVQDLLAPPRLAAGQALEAEPVAAGEEELAAAERVTYRIRQRLRYTYDGPARGLTHRLVVLPPNRHGDQVSRYGELVISAPDATVAWERGPDGQRTATITLDEVPGLLDFDVTAVVDRGPAAGWPALPASALTGRRLLAPTPLTTPDESLTAVARRLAGPDPLTTARRCCAWVFENIAYRPGSTTVGTTAAQAAAGGAGVCQDQAHVMIALCRAAGLPARYVLGHLLGDGASHAWAEVVLPDGWAPPPPGPPARGQAGRGWAAPGGAGAVAVALDPCHNQLADRRYVTIAAGRDYQDVMPTSGWYCGSGRGALTTTQRVEVVELAGLPPRRLAS